jgi:lysophospholipid acyltransferase (LPLAT)-like uncharacterized protein
MLSDMLQTWGYTLLRGSSSNGGKEVLLRIISAAKENYVLITPDGPRGPRQEFKAGAIVAAQRSGAKIVFVKANIINKYKFYRSWDRFEFPYPFAKIKIFISEPETVNCPDRESLNLFIKDYESRMNQTYA